MDTPLLNLILLALASGVLTIIAPCIISLLPIMLGSSLGHHRLRPLVIVLGMVASFTAFGLFFAFFSRFLGLNRFQLRDVSVVLILLFGLSLLFPHAYDRVVATLQSAWSRLCMAARGGTLPPPKQPKNRQGLWGGFTLGASMGLAWTPCSGPVLGLILTIGASQQEFLRPLILFLAYALGAGIPMLVIGYGGQFIVGRVRWLATKAELIRRVAGGVLTVMALAMVWGLDREIQTRLFNLFPDTTAIEGKLLERQIPEVEQMPDKKNPADLMPVLERN